MSLYECLKDVIENKQYKSKDEVITRLEAFHKAGLLKDSQYQELMDLTNKIYG